MAVSLGYEKVYRYPEGFPDWREHGLPVASVDSPAIEETEVPAVPVFGWALVLMLAGVFVGGLALNLTPCVYPLIPITVTYFGGRSGRSQGAVVVHGLCYLAGLVITNSALGVVAGLTGGMMGALLQNPLVLVGVAGILLLLATSMFGLWEMRMPSGLTQVAARSHGGYFGTLFMGLAMGVVAAPCIGPFVLGLLTLVAESGSAWYGFLIFFTLSLGLGLPLFALAVFSGRIDRLPRSGEWMLWVRRLMGWILIGMAAYFLRPILPEPLGLLTIATVALVAGVAVGWLDPIVASFRSFAWIKRAMGLSGVVLGTYLITAWALLGPGVGWQHYSDELLAHASREGKAVIIDFSAGWCTPCRKLEAETFHDSRVVQAAKDLVMIKVDVTGGDIPLHDRLLRHYEVKGVPTLIMLDDQGREHRELRVVDFVPAEEMLRLMEELSVVMKGNAR